MQRGGRGDSKIDVVSILRPLIILMFFIGLAGWFVFLWAVKTGQFDDIERPKHRMMDEDS